MAAPDGIDYAWALRTGGALSPRQKRQLLAPLVRTVLQYPAARLRLATGRCGTARIDLDALRWPDSSLATAATETAQAELSPWVLQHSYRTYLFGLLLAQVQGVRVDEELVFVASMLHDTTLETRTPGRCFAVTGAERAHAFCVAHGATSDTADAVGAAVAGHITVGEADDLGTPAGFVSAGAFADLTGVGLQDAEPRWVDAVVARHPRLRFSDELLPTWRAEGRAVPEGRARWLTRYAALPLLIRLSPFDE